MAKIDQSEDEDLLHKNGSGSDEEDDIEDEDLDDTSDDEDSDDEDDEDDDSDDSKSKSDKYRGKLNAQNRFLIKEGYENVNGKWVKPNKPEARVEKKSSVKPQGMTPADVFVLVKANVPEEDIEDVTEYATFKKISIKEALQTNFVKSLLSDKAEERATAEATHTGSARRSLSKKSTANILDDASRGVLPDDPTQLAQARLKKRMQEKDSRKSR